MSTSLYESFVAHSPFYTQNESLDVFAGTVVLANNLNHLADEAGQVRAAMVLPSTRSIQISPSDATYDTDQWYLMWRAPVPVTIKADGSGYDLRVRISGARDSNAGTATSTFRLGVSSPRQILADMNLGASLANVTQTSAITVSTAGTIVWNHTDQLTISSEIVNDSMVDMPTTTTVSGNAISVPVAMCECQVWGKTNEEDWAPYLFGVLVQEYVGA